MADPVACIPQPNSVGENLDPYLMPFLAIMFFTMWPVHMVSSRDITRFKYHMGILPAWVLSLAMSGVAFFLFWKSHDPTWGPTVYELANPRFNFYFVLVCHFAYVAFEASWLYCGFHRESLWASTVSAFIAFFWLMFATVRAMQYSLGNGSFYLGACAIHLVVCGLSAKSIHDGATIEGATSVVPTEGEYSKGQQLSDLARLVGSNKVSPPAQQPMLVVNVSDNTQNVTSSPWKGVAPNRA